jgi:putative sterol carrier protein
VFRAGCDAITAVVPRLTALIRANSDLARPVVGDWGIAELAAHISHVMRVDTNALTGGPLPDIEHPLSRRGVAAMTASLLADDPERDPSVLADRIDRLAAEFVPLPASAVACHLLEELLLHGFDIAKAAGTPWQIEPAHAALVITGAVVPVLTAEPRTFVKADKARGFNARIEMRLRGYDKFVFVFNDGALTAEAASRARADVHLSACPDQLLLVMMNRIPQWRPFLTGKVAVWGRRPDYLMKMMSVVAGP